MVQYVYRRTLFSPQVNLRKEIKFNSSLNLKPFNEEIDNNKDNKNEELE